MCPVCQEPLVAFELDGVEIDRCIHCGGTWLDVGELETISELAGVPSVALRLALSEDRSGRRTRRRCPRCWRRLREILISDEPQVKVDRCLRGHGLWLDRDEMEQIIRSFASGEGEVVAHFFADLYRHELEATERGS